MATIDRLKLAVSSMRQGLWRSAGPYYNLAIREGLSRAFPPARRDRSDGADLPGGKARVVGLLSTATGVGQSSRLCVEALRAEGYGVATTNLSPLFRVDDNIAFEPGRSTSEPTLSIYHFNPPLMMLAMLVAGPRRYYRGLNIGYWAWELPELPPEWRVALRYVDAILVPSTFCRDIVAAHTSKPVLVVPHPAKAPPPPTGAIPPPRERPFRVLNVFNCGSSLFRKNPIAVIDAFKLAFGDDPTVELILKVSDGRQHQADMATLRERIGSAGNIRILDALMAPDELDALMRSADVLISLHRSEGFGLTVAEAILRDLPVVVTDWSGTRDFCLPGLAYTVDYRLVPVSDPHPAYCHVGGTVWAEPSVEVAAHRLIEIREDRADATRRAAELKRHLTAHIAGNSYSDALAALLGDRTSRATTMTDGSASGQPSTLR